MPPDRSVRRSLTGLPLDLDVETLGAAGDGIARFEDIPVYIPLALPGDRVRLLVGPSKADGFAARLLDVLVPGSSRVSPPCPHFGECGGCALQHVDPAVIAPWKRQRVVDALAHRGMRDADVRTTVTVPAESARRRVAFAAFRGDKGLAVGFHARGSRRVIEVSRCLLLTSALNDLKAGLPILLEGVLAPGESCQAQATDLDGALDLVLALPRPPNRGARTRIAAVAAELGVARLSWRPAKKADAEPEPLASLAPCRVSFSGVEVEFPPGAFLQPSVPGEQTLCRLVLDSAGEAGPALDLFSGLGPFAFSLLKRGLSGRKAQVRAFEGSAVLAQASVQAAARAGLGGRMVFESRDLEQRPLAPAEMDGSALCVFDPPRIGAKAQAAMLAQAPRSLTRIVAVSCNPASFARDARLLVDGGWTFDHATPVDQFAYSPHVEVVALFSRPRRG